MVASYYVMIVTIPACLLAYAVWQTAQFVTNPVPMYDTAQVAVPHYKTLKIYNQEQARERVIAIARERKLNQTDTDSLLRVIQCESKFQQFDLGVNKDGSVDRGIMQWNSHWHSKMTNEQAFNLDYAVNKAIDYWQADKQHHWTCY